MQYNLSWFMGMYFSVVVVFDFEDTLDNTLVMAHAETASPNAPIALHQYDGWHPYLRTATDALAFERCLTDYTTIMPLTNTILTVFNATAWTGEGAGVRGIRWDAFSPAGVLVTNNSTNINPNALEVVNIGALIPGPTFGTIEITTDPTMRHGSMVASMLEATTWGMAGQLGRGSKNIEFGIPY